MSKAEKMFWIGLFLAAGMIIGALMVALTHNVKKFDCNDGMSEQIESGTSYNFGTGRYEYAPVRKKTYIPANDTCKEVK